MAWRDTANDPKIWFLDIRALFPVGLWFLHFSFATLYIAIAGIAFFTLLDQRGLTVPVAWRVFRSWVAGRVRWAQRPGSGRRRVASSMRPGMYDP